MKPPIAFDVETTGLNPAMDDIFSFAVCDTSGGCFTVRREHPEFLRMLADVWADPEVPKICHNLKFDYDFTRRVVHIPENTVVHDTLIMSQLLNNLRPSHTLDDLAWSLCKYPRTWDQEVASAVRQYGSYEAVPRHTMSKYQEADVERTMLLFQTWWPEFEKDPARLADYQTEIGMILLTIDMQERGVKIHRKNTEDLVRWLQEQIPVVDEEVKAEVGEYVNLRSQKQVEHLLFTRLGIPPVKLTKSGAYSTKKDVIYELRSKYPEHKVIGLLSKHRSYSHALPIIRSYLDLADEKDVIHPTIQTNQARTGRQSCRNPNLQNVSKDSNQLNPDAIGARQCFRPRLGFVNLHVDYAGIEIRLAINVSGDRDMLARVLAGGDPHTIAAELFYGEPFINEQDKSAKKRMRGAAKNGQFAIIYGAGFTKVAATLGLDPMLVRPRYQAYQRQFPALAFFTRTMADQVKRNGYITTPLGRRLYIEREKAYVGGNYIIQGVAAQVLKRAQVNLAPYLRERWEGRVQMLLPIHDELIIEVPVKVFEDPTLRGELLYECSKRMTAFPEFKLPMEAEWKVTYTTWNQARELSHEDYAAISRATTV